MPPHSSPQGLAEPEAYGNSKARHGDSGRSGQLGELAAPSVGPVPRLGKDGAYDGGTNNNGTYNSGTNDNEGKYAHNGGI